MTIKLVLIDLKTACENLKNCSIKKIRETLLTGVVKPDIVDLSSALSINPEAFHSLVERLAIIYGDDDVEHFLHFLADPDDTHITILFEEFYAQPFRNDLVIDYDSVQELANKQFAGDILDLLVTLTVQPSGNALIARAVTKNNKINMNTLNFCEEPVGNVLGKWNDKTDSGLARTYEITAYNACNFIKFMQIFCYKKFNTFRKEGNIDVFDAKKMGDQYQADLLDDYQKGIDILTTRLTDLSIDLNKFDNDSRITFLCLCNIYDLNSIAFLSRSLFINNKKGEFTKFMEECKYLYLQLPEDTQNRKIDSIKNFTDRKRGYKARRKAIITYLSSVPEASTNQFVSNKLPMPMTYMPLRPTYPLHPTLPQLPWMNVMNSQPTFSFPQQFSSLLPPRDEQAQMFTSLPKPLIYSMTPRQNVPSEASTTTTTTTTQTATHKSKLIVRVLPEINNCKLTYVGEALKVMAKDSSGLKLYMREAYVTSFRLFMQIFCYNKFQKFQSAYHLGSDKEIEEIVSIFDKNKTGSEYSNDILDKFFSKIGDIKLANLEIDLYALDVDDIIDVARGINFRIDRRLNKSPQVLAANLHVKDNSSFVNFAKFLDQAQQLLNLTVEASTQSIDEPEPDQLTVIRPTKKQMTSPLNTVETLPQPAQLTQHFSDRLFNQATNSTGVSSQQHMQPRNLTR